MEIGTIKQSDIRDEMQGAYLDYAMSVITARALPDVRDGLKPVQRRILFGMSEMGLRHNTAYKKCARIVGDVLGRYHPHGDQAVYDALVRMAQDFTMRYPLVDGQGNFGCFTGDTRIMLLDGTDKSFAEMAALGPEAIFYVYAVNEQNQIVVAQGNNARITRRSAKLIQVTLDNGEAIRCTPDHRFMLRDGSYKQAQDLTPDDSLMPGYFDTTPIKERLNDYLRMMQPATGEYEFVHHLADKFNAEQGDEGSKYNHCVADIHWLDETADVYDITVDCYHNFLLSSGVFVHNSIDNDPPAAMRYCITGDTLVVTARGLRPIAQMSADGSEDVNLQVLSRNGAINSASKWWDCGAFPTRRVRTRRGYELVGTLNHPLLTAAPDELNGRTKLTWKLISEIQPGDYVVLDRSEVLWPEQEVNLEKHHPILPKGSRTERHDLPFTLNADLAMLMGALIAEGTFRPAVVEFTNTHGDFADAFQAAWAHVFPDCRLHVFERKPFGYGKKPFLQMQVVSQQVIAFLNALGLSGRSSERQIPSVILCSPKNIAAAFLRGLFEGDGAAEKSGRSLLRVNLSSRNRAMLQVIQTLLLRFGIASAVRPDATRNMYRLLISGRDNLAAFQSQIGFVSEVKQSALSSVMALHTGRAFSKSDYVPFFSEYVRAHAQRGQREWLSKHNFDRDDRLTATLPRLQKALSASDYAFVESLARSHYLFEQVTSVEDTGEQRVYSLRVDSECHSFVANGFINHNTEARLTELAEEMLLDIEKDTVDFRPNFDETMKEPTVLPAKVPNLLLNGTAGIAVGMATLVPPHNLREIVDAINYLIEHWNKVDDIEPDDLMQFVKGPDFPTGGIILGVDGIKEAYATGKGRIMVRAKIHTEQVAGGRSRIIVTELPYQVNKSALIERIAELVRDRKLEEIGDLRDESDRQGMSIIIELKRGVEPTPVINQLLKHTQLQAGFSINMLALVDGEPRVLSLKRVLQLYVQHRQIVITRRSQYELERAKMRAHILEGLKIALDHLDEVIRTIRQSPDAETARERLMKRFKLSELQATAILDMQLRRLAALERKKIEDELAEVHKRIRQLEELLRSPKKILGVIQEEIGNLKERFGDGRRTFIAASAEMEFKEEAHADEAENLVAVTREGYIRRSGLNQFRRTRKDAEKGVQSREEDPVIHLFIASTHDNLVLLTNRGRAVPLRMSQVPDVARNPTGLLLKNQLEGDERIIAALPINNAKFLTLATSLGKIKRTAIEEFGGIQSGGTRAINLAEGDELGWAHVTQGGGNLLLITAQGQALRFEEEEVPVQGRAAAGVWAIKLAEGDRVASLDCVVEDEWLALATANGFAKRTALKEFPVKGRYTSGVVAIEPDGKTGPVVAACVVDVEDDVTFNTRNGSVVRIRAENIAKGSRSARAKSLVDLKGDDAVESLVSLVGRLERQPGEEEGEPEEGETTKEATVEAVPAVKGNGHEAKAEKDGQTTEGKKGKGKAEPGDIKEPKTQAKLPDSKKARAKEADEEEAKTKPRPQAEGKKAQDKEEDKQVAKPKARAQAEGKKAQADKPEPKARAQEETKPKAKEPPAPPPKTATGKSEAKKEPAPEKQMELELPAAGFKPLPKKKK